MRVLPLRWSPRQGSAGVQLVELVSDCDKGSCSGFDTGTLPRNSTRYSNGRDGKE